MEEIIRRIRGRRLTRDIRRFEKYEYHGNFKEYFTRISRVRLSNNYNVRRGIGVILAEFEGRSFVVGLLSEKAVCVLNFPGRVSRISPEKSS